MKKQILGTASITLALAISPLMASAQDMDHSGHGASQQSHETHGAQANEGAPANHDAHANHNMADASGAENALVAYREALTQRDADAMTALFTDASLVVENGKVEGTFAEYMEHHLGPELDAIQSFEFFDPQTEIEMLGAHAALGRETYRYRIELTDGRVFERTGVATSVLTHEPGEQWKIMRYHSSSRAP